MKILTQHFMNTNLLAKIARATCCAALIASAQAAFAQGFNAGSDGSLGDVVIDANTTLDLPPDGKLQYKSLTVSAGVRLNFRRNARNTPAFILSQGDVIVNGTIDANGSQAGSNNGGASGPGGFDGGKPGFGAEVPPGNGYGPGGGIAGDQGCDVNNSAGGGSYGTRGAHGGSTYGSVLLIPLIGGSGGGGATGQPGSGGGGGGGAILISANTRVVVNGRIEARGGANINCFHGGSGGAIRLVSFKVEGTGTIDVSPGGSGGFGRIRVDTIDHGNLNFTFLNSGVTTVGGNLLSFPPTIPTLATIEAAGNSVAQGGGPVTFTLPFGSSPDRTVKIQARDFGRLVPIRITLTPDSGSPITVDSEIDNTSLNPATVEVPITIPVNTLVTLHAWTR
jgi:hypothetical protein